GDGHLWELVQQDGNEHWVDDGMPASNGNVAVAPLMFAPSIIPSFSGGSPVTKVFMVNASGALVSFRHAVDESDWQFHNAIGANNCFGRAGKLGEGGPKAITFVDHNGATHEEVFVIGGDGDMFSWRDGSWEEIFDTQYSIQVSHVVNTSSLPDFNGRPVGDIRICPNGGFGPTPPGPDPSNAASVKGPDDAHPYLDYTYGPDYQHIFNGRGTPEAAVWKQGNKLIRAVYAQSGGGLWEFVIEGDDPLAAASTQKSATVVVQDCPPNTQFGCQQIQNVKFTKTPVTSGKVIGVGQFCAQADNTDVRDSLISDPAVVQTDNDVFVLMTDIQHRLAVAHRLTATPSAYHWQLRPFPGGSDFTNAISGTAGGLPGFTSLPLGPTTGTGAVGLVDVETLEVFGIRSTGVLFEGMASSDGAVGEFEGCDPDANCPSRATCHPTGDFQWFTDAAHDHRPSVVPAILDNSAATSLNTSSPFGGRANCNHETLLDTLLPQWISPQRRSTSIQQQEYNGAPFNQGYDDDVMVEIEGVVVNSHIAAIDNILNHTHGIKDDIPRVHHDWNLIIAPDIAYQKLLTDANMLEGGVMELEWEMADHLQCIQYVPILGLQFCVKWGRATPQDNLANGDPMRAGFTPDALPAIGDRVAVRGRFIFDCGHPPYRAEIHPIDAIAVIHGNDSVKFRYSDMGGMTWYQPGDVNLPGQGCQVQNRLLDLATTLTAKPNVSGWGPLDDIISDIKWAENLISDYNFITNGCTQYYDTELISPNALDQDTQNSTTCYTPYLHAMNERFSESTVPTTAFPYTLPFNNGDYTFDVPGGGPHFAPSFAAAAGATTNLFTNTRPAHHLNICYTRNAIFPHDNVDGHTGTVCQLTGFDCCDDNKTQELVTWITANDQAKLYSDNDENCLQVTVFGDDTLNIGSHGFECDFSCGEKWGDPDFAGAADERIGFVRAAFTRAQNWGIGRTFTVSSQPDFGTTYSRATTFGDYKMTVTITEQ
ncbi:MAG TPA: hypothetical protein VN903_35605, partial [Polyangia bacterium]|nr:hypothetical protein [Polyangia bacterium]